MTAYHTQQRNPFVNISNTANINNVPSRHDAANTNKHNVSAPYQSKKTVPPMNQYQATFQTSVPHCNTSGSVYGSEKCWYPVQSTKAYGDRANSNHCYVPIQGYSYSSQPYYMGWNNTCNATYPRQGFGHYWPIQSTAIPKRPYKPIQPREPHRPFLVELREDNIKSVFHECMDVCNKEMSIKAFEDLLEQGVKINCGWLKKVFFEEDVPNNRLLKLYAMSILLTFDAQVGITMRGKLAHAWGTTLERLRRWRNIMKESTSFLPAIAKHQIDFRGHKTNPFLMYNASLEVEKIERLIEKLGTDANGLEEKMHMEGVLQANKDRILMQQSYIDTLQGTEKTLEEENKELSNTLKHWKSCYSKLEQENEDLKKCINLPNKAEI